MRDRLPVQILQGLSASEGCSKYHACNYSNSMRDVSGTTVRQRGFISPSGWCVLPTCRVGALKTGLGLEKGLIFVSGKKWREKQRSELPIEGEIVPSVMIFR